MTAFYLFHWSPAAHRTAITTGGLTPGSPTADGRWRPPYVCFASDPQTAWNLRGKDADGCLPAHEVWDLWMVASDVPERVEGLFAWYPDIGEQGPLEWRVHEPIAADCCWHVGSRST